MNERYAEYLVSPIKHKPLNMKSKSFVTVDGVESYSIIKNVPVMLSTDTVSRWHRELIEAILWQFPEEIEKMYSEIDFKTYRADTYIKWIKKLLGDKQGILSALDEYAKADTEKWIVQGTSDTCIDKETLHNFKQCSTRRTGKKRTVTKINAEGIFKLYPYFADETLKNNPYVIVELATGAGGGTAAVALKKPLQCTLFTVDISFACMGNAIGIAKYLGQKNTLLPVCANFWYLPYADESINTVCTYCGLDESRENEKTISEIARILKPGGSFVCTSRKDAFMRQGNILAPFGFTKEETIEILKKCRLYSDLDTMIYCCESHGIYLTEKREYLRDAEQTFVISTFTRH